jgi:hypothetical protein
MGSPTPPVATLTLHEQTVVVEFSAFLPTLSSGKPWGQYVKPELPKAVRILYIGPVDPQGTTQVTIVSDKEVLGNRTDGSSEQKRSTGSVSTAKEASASFVAKQ